MNDLFVPIVAGLVVAIAVGVWKNLFGIRKDNDIPHENKVSSTLSNNPQIIINNNPSISNINGSIREGENESGKDLKARVKILFVEDQVFKQVENLKKAGWQVEQVREISSLDMYEVRNANIIFVDYKGVGKLSSDQGRGLVKQLKRRYGQSKWVVFYSAHSFTLDVHDIGADGYLSKESDFYEIERKIIEGAQQVAV